MIGDASFVPGTEEGAERAVAGMDVVMLGQEGRMQDGQGAERSQGGRYENHVDLLPVAFETDGSGTPPGQRFREIDQRAGQDPENGTIRCVVEISHYTARKRTAFDIADYCVHLPGAEAERRTHLSFGFPYRAAGISSEGLTYT